MLLCALSWEQDSGAPAPLSTGSETQGSGIKAEDGRSPLPLGAFTSYRCSGETRPRRQAAERTWVGVGAQEGQLLGRPRMLFGVPAGGR